MVRQKPPEPREKLMTGRPWLDMTLGVLLVALILVSPFVQLIRNPSGEEQYLLLTVISIAVAALTIWSFRQRHYRSFAGGGILATKVSATVFLMIYGILTIYGLPVAGLFIYILWKKWRWRWR